MTELLLSFVRAAITNRDVPSGELDSVTEETWQRLYRYASSQNLAHLVGHVLMRMNRLPAGRTGEMFRRAFFQAACLDAQLEQATDLVSSVFEKAGICHIPLKGAVLRRHYPETFMRTRSDVDILLPRDRLSEAAELLRRECAYSPAEKEGAHDLTVETPDGIHIELHYALLADKGSNDYLIRESFERGKPLFSGASFSLEMPDDIFYAFHLAHMAKHVQNGGCGIRPFLDLYILCTRVPFDAEQRAQTIRAIGMEKFAAAAEKLARVWFDGLPSDPATARFSEYILSAGINGSMRNRVAVEQVKKKGKFRSLLSQLWQPLSRLRFEYPVLNRHPYLLPFCELRRVFHILFFRRGRAKKELRVRIGMSKTEREKAMQLMDDLGLN